RAALACYHATLPPQASWEAWSDDIDPHLRFPISTTAEAWKGSTRRATVSAFGFGGLNAFTVLESAPPRATARLPASPLLFCCGAETPALLDAHLCDLATAIERLDPDLLGAAAFTLSVTRSASRWRATFIATTAHDVLERITDARQALSTPTDAPRRAGGDGLVGPVSNPLPPCSRGGDSACGHSDLYDIDVPPLLRQGLAWLQGHAVDLTGLYPEAARHIVDLPIAALERERFWPVAPRPQAVSDADREASHERPPPPLASSSPSAPAEPAPRRERPADAIARIAARSGTDVQPSHRLVADLGFDSIMFVELATHLARVHGVQPSQAFWATDPTVAEITALVKTDPTCAFPEQVTMSTTTHPFLRDHALQGRPFVPLASALDLFAWSQGLTPPFALHDVRVTRGVMVRGETRLRVTRDANALALLETRGTRNEVTAFEARIGDMPEALEPLSPAGADSEPAPRTAPPMRDLDAFYRDHTFHGPRMRAIACVTRMQSASIEGRVRTSTPREGAPADPRERWHVDLHMIDGAFQLALYLAAHSLDKGLLPQDIGAFVVLSAPAPGLVDVRIDVERHEGDALWARFTLSQNGTPICFMRGVHAKVVPLLTRSRTWQVAEAQRRIEAFPEVRELEARRTSWGTLYPYFEPYDGVAGSAVSVGGQPRIAFTHYDYLGLNGHPDINAAAQDAIARHGTTVGASRLVAGELTLHRTLEQALADFLGVDDCVAMVSGHATNQSVISTLVGPGDLVL
ncbi:MAG: hypothetical protein EB084_24060, partial [Proteobacteria bacterium]|nr:hypothetical protein [Pseudomonadota bacterium]